MSSEHTPLLSRDNEDEIEGIGPSSDSKGHQFSTSQKMTILTSLYIGVLLAALDGTIVASLLSHIATEFGDMRSVSWIASSYMIATAACQPLFGKISDIFGRRPCLIFSNVMFGAGCLISGLATSLPLLIFGRLIQGVGGGGLIALASVTISDIVSLRDRGLYQGISNIVFGVGASLGGTIGGIIDDHFGWRWSLLIQTPVVVISILMLMLFLNLPTSHEGHFIKRLERVDFSGSLTLTSALTAWLLALNLGGTYYSWGSPVIVALFAAFVLMFSTFIYVELYVSAEPIIPVRLFKNNTISICALTSLLGGMAAYSYIFYVPMYVETARNGTASESGSRLAMNFVGVALGSLTAGFVIKWTGTYKRLLNISTFFYVAANLSLWSWNQSTSTSYQMVNMVCLGFGYSIILTVCLIALLSAAPPEMQAVSSSIQYSSRGSGSTMGIALASSIFQNKLPVYLDMYVQGPEKAKVIKLALETSRIDSFPEMYRSMIMLSYSSATKSVFTLTVSLATVIFLLSFAVKQYNLSR